MSFLWHLIPSTFGKHQEQHTPSIKITMPRLTMRRELQPLWKIINLCHFAWSNLTQVVETFRVPHPPHDYLRPAVVFVVVVCHLRLPQLATTAFTTILQWFQSLHQNTLLRAYARSFFTDSNIDSFGRGIFDHYVSAPVLDVIDNLINTRRNPSGSVVGPSAPPMSLDYVPTTKAQSVMRSMVACVAREVFMFMLCWLLRSLDCCSSQQGPPQTQQQTETSEGGTEDAHGSEDGGTEQNDEGRDSGNGGNEQSGDGSDAGDGREDDGGNNQSGSKGDKEHGGKDDNDEDGNSESGSEGEDEGYGGSEKQGGDEEEHGGKEDEQEEEDDKGEDAESESEAESAARDEAGEGETTQTTDHDHDHDDGGVSIISSSNTSRASSPASPGNASTNTSINAQNPEEPEEPEQPERFRFIERDHLGRRNAWDWTNIPTMPDPSTAFLLRRARRVCRHRRNQDETDGRQE